MNHTRSGDFNLTKIQTRLFVLLEDGQAHSTEECLLQACGKRFASPSLVPTHVDRLRTRIARAGYRITHARGAGYQMLKQEQPDA